MQMKQQNFQWVDIKVAFLKYLKKMVLHNLFVEKVKTLLTFYY